MQQAGAQLVSQPPTPDRGPLPVMGQHSPKKFLRYVCQRTERLIFFVACRRPLPVNPLNLFGKHQPTARHFFKCSFYGRACCFCRALLGLGRFLSVDVRTQRHTRQTPDRRSRSFGAPPIPMAAWLPASPTRLHNPQASPVLDHSRALPQSDARRWPARRAARYSL